MISFRSAQASAHLAQARSFSFFFCALCAILSSGVLSLSSCTLPPSNSSLIKGVEVDGLVQSNDIWYVFQFGSLRYLRVPEKTEAWNNNVLNSQEGWMQIASPGGAFRPVQAVKGIHGHFYLVDAAEGRLCLYDTAAQLLSIFPLPPSALPVTPGRSAVFFAGDDGFTFIDYQTDEATQFADRQGSEGGTDWVLRNRVKLPLGLRDCIQEPRGPGIACGVPDGFIHLDAALNRVDSHLLTSNGSARIIWDADAAGWVLQGFEKDSEKPLFQFWAAQQRLEAMPPLSP
jgi:hypothetical protein